MTPQIQADLIQQVRVRNEALKRGDDEAAREAHKELMREVGGYFNPFGDRETDLILAGATYILARESDFPVARFRNDLRNTVAHAMSEMSEDGSSDEFAEQASWVYSLLIKGEIDARDEKVEAILRDLLFGLKCELEPGSPHGFRSSILRCIARNQAPPEGPISPLGASPWR